jgi:hypothetical protein
MPTKTSVGPNEVVRLEVLRLAPPSRRAFGNENNTPSSSSSQQPAARSQEPAHGHSAAGGQQQSAAVGSGRGRQWAAASCQLPAASIQHPAARRSSGVPACCRLPWRCALLGACGLCRAASSAGFGVICPSPCSRPPANADAQRQSPIHSRACPSPSHGL